MKIVTLTDKTTIEEIMNAHCVIWPMEEMTIEQIREKYGDDEAKKASQYLPPTTGWK